MLKYLLPLTLLYGKGKEEKSNCAGMPQRVPFGEKGCRTHSEDGLGAAHRLPKGIGCDGSARERAGSEMTCRGFCREAETNEGGNTKLRLSSSVGRRELFNFIEKGEKS